MKRTVLIAIAAALALALAGQASAQAPNASNPSPDRRGALGPGNGAGPRCECRMRQGTCAPRLHRREMRQQCRIQRGVAGGSITPGEARGLRMHQRHIRGMELRARRDGDFSLRERARVNRALDRQGARIRRMAHSGRAI
jgi:hypothetical protein